MIDLSKMFKPYEFLYGKPEMKKVKVDKIMGVFRSLRKHRYKDDWTPKKPDDRWRMIFEFAQDNGDISKLGQPDYPIRLVEFEGNFYVWYDGHRRVSIAKMLNKKKLAALVTPIKRWM